ncbi:hypothetical protein [Chondromyces apiculatus]|uniref:Uncharacterized protein n=1 Tax=Chondromyces apiculatus DSM 436 TaxID=1192034 RepID=A0A017TDT4_9BACT|nr:hypothetical protein [Chondromyces apiculatus]EYF07037.1 Hypothetical protein CAP_1296 [Chondromyces apiculatus DSM 436]
MLSRERAFLGGASDTSVHVGAGSSEGDTFSPAELWGIVARTWAAQRERAHKIPAEVVADLSRISDSTRARILARFELLAARAQLQDERFGAAFERVCDAAFRWWIGQPGARGYLSDRRHPLHELERDLDRVTSELAITVCRPATLVQAPIASAEPPRDYDPERSAADGRRALASVSAASARAA